MACGAAARPCMLWRCADGAVVRRAGADRPQRRRRGRRARGHGRRLQLAQLRVNALHLRAQLAATLHERRQLRPVAARATAHGGDRRACDRCSRRRTLIGGSGTPPVHGCSRVLRCGPPRRSTNAACAGMRLGRSNVVDVTPAESACAISGTCGAVPLRCVCVCMSGFIAGATVRHVDDGRADATIPPPRQKHKQGRDHDPRECGRAQKNWRVPPHGVCWERRSTRWALEFRPSRIGNDRNRTSLIGAVRHPPAVAALESPPELEPRGAARSARAHSAYSRMTKSMRSLGGRSRCGWTTRPPLPWPVMRALWEGLGTSRGARGSCWRSMHRVLYGQGTHLAPSKWPTYSQSRSSVRASRRSVEG